MQTCCQTHLTVGRAMFLCRDEIKDSGCKARVTKTQEVAASDIRFDIPLAEACYQDRKKYCGGVAPGSARVIRCLQDRSAPWSSSTLSCTAILCTRKSCPCASPSLAGCGVGLFTCLLLGIHMLSSRQEGSSSAEDRQCPWSHACALDSNTLPTC